jgi:PAS domain-containing protein
LPDLNLTGANLLGKERSILKNSKLGFFVSDDTRPIFNQFLGNVFNSRVKVNCELTISFKGRLPTYVYLTGIAANNNEQCLVTLVDTTERRRAEELRKETQKKLNLALDNGKIGIWERDFISQS